MLNAEKYRDEIQKLLDRGYDATLNKKTKKIVACKETNCNNCAFFTNKSCVYEREKWLISVCEESILDEVEKEYLRGVIRPFRDKVDSIRKIAESEKIESILIYVNSFNDSKDVIYLPRFEKGKMYQNMKDGKYYTLEELGL